MYFLGGVKEGTYFRPNTFRLLLLTDSSTSPAYVNSAMRLVVMEVLVPPVQAFQEVQLEVQQVCNRS